MSDQWIVLLRTGSPEEIIAYGPMDARTAEEFAQWLSATVDPAVPRRLASPVGEMLAWHRSEYERNECTLNADCPVHPGLAHDTAAS